MFADELRRAIEAASRITLPQVTALLWRAYGDGKVTEAEAEALSGLIEARTLSAPRRGHNLCVTQVLRSPVSGSSPDPASAAYSGSTEKPQSSPRRPGVGSRPRTGASMERRRRWAASGRMPLGLAAKFTHAEQGVLALVAAETARRGDCRLAMGHVAAIVGVSETTVRNAIREARKLGLGTVEERPVTGFRNLPNIGRIVSAEWTAWLRLSGKGSITPGGGGKSPQRCPTEVLVLKESGISEPQRVCRNASGSLVRRTRS
ncbi:helix-turn-helix domain-containing protein [Methylobacterium sp. J-048]|uniref:helix-turn-helix domain-containing protein n=1 Tax=Methylobacterium sp. J-048 TaxID=2836635 RepID=UPI001FBB468B|nr:helix-turn-helix domain-containing protein [Methylobacterium sp. J-048]MCJ2057291.1 helix-turn-helix domain-containing protein [Methylobacterium sp. J-048]